MTLWDLFDPWEGTICGISDGGGRGDAAVGGDWSEVTETRRAVRRVIELCPTDLLRFCVVQVQTHLV